MYCATANGRGQYPKHDAGSTGLRGASSKWGVAKPMEGLYKADRGWSMVVYRVYYKACVRPPLGNSAPVMALDIFHLSDFYCEPSGCSSQNPTYSSCIYTYAEISLYNTQIHDKTETYLNTYRMTNPPQLRDIQPSICLSQRWFARLAKLRVTEKWVFEEYHGFTNYLSGILPPYVGSPLTSLV